MRSEGGGDWFEAGERDQPLEARNGKERDFPLEPSEGVPPC